MCSLPPLFLSVAKALTRDLIEAKRDVSFKDIKVSGSFHLSLYFFDDFIIFCDRTRKNVENINHVLYLHYKATRMMVNVDKSSTSFIGVSDEDKTLYIDNIPYK